MLLAESTRLLSWNLSIVSNTKWTMKLFGKEGRTMPRITSFVGISKPIHHIMPHPYFLSSKPKSNHAFLSQRRSITHQRIIPTKLIIRPKDHTIRNCKKYQSMDYLRNAPIWTPQTITRHKEWSVFEYAHRTRGCHCPILAHEIDDCTRTTSKSNHVLDK